MKELNILMDTKGGIKICDFGLAYQFKTDEETQCKASGTVGYMAPE